MFAALALLALVIETVAGYPDALFKRIGHPVTWIGRLIASSDAAWNDAKLTFGTRRLRGVGLVVLLLAVSAAAGVAITALAYALLPGALALLVVAVAASSLLAAHSLDEHVSAVAEALEKEGLEAGREAVSRIVGRDTKVLDESGVSRAAIESLAENFSDGVVAPLLWMVVGGLPGVLCYKAVNTADSMIGHKSERHLAFGWAAARLDDLINLPASRLAALWLVLAAAVVPGAEPRAAMRAIRRDARRHRSPNAGWPESAMAGALSIRLAGPRQYAGRMVDDHTMGDGRADLTAADIRSALRLYRVACLIEAAAVGMLALALWLSPS